MQGASTSPTCIYAVCPPAQATAIGYKQLVEELAKRGHKLKELPTSGKVNLLVRTADGIDAASEPRSPSQPAGY